MKKNLTAKSPSAVKNVQTKLQVAAQARLKGYKPEKSDKPAFLLKKKS